MPLDFWLFQTINGLAGRIPALDGLMRLLVNDYFPTTAMTLLLVALWFEGRTQSQRERNQRAVLRALVAMLVANILLKLCNLAHFRPRPFAGHEVNLLFYRPSDSSFPSNPATVGFSLATAVWLSNLRASAVLFCLAASWAFARIYCGVHYPSDVVAGALLGALCAYLTVKRARFLDPLLTLAIEVGRRLYLA